MFQPKFRVENKSDLYTLNESEDTMIEVVKERDSHGNVIKTECYLYKNKTWVQMGILNG